MRRPAVAGKAQRSNASATAAACRMVFGALRNIVGTLGLRLTSAPEFRGLGPRREQALARDGRRLLTSVLYMGLRTILLRIICVFLLASLLGRALFASIFAAFRRATSEALCRLFESRPRVRRPTPCAVVCEASRTARAPRRGCLARRALA